MTATWTKPYPFDPEADLPPEGAEVTLVGRRFRFTSAGMWESPSGYVARPFSLAGVNLAREWAKTLEASRA